MMTRKPSGKVARLKYLGVIPAILVSLMLFSFTQPDEALILQEEQPTMEKNVGEDNDMPLFPGCEEVSAADQKLCSITKLNEYIGNNLVYPKKLRKEGIEGKVIARFVVEGDGQVKDVTIVKSLHADADLAVLNLILGMNKNVGSWTPATKDGKPVNVEMHLPVVFEFGEDE